MKIRQACKLCNMSKRYFKRYADWSDMGVVRGNLYGIESIIDADGIQFFINTRIPNGRNVNALCALDKWKMRENDIELDYRFPRRAKKYRILNAMQIKKR